MKTLLSLIVFVGLALLNSVAAQPLLATNAPISTVFYEFFEPHTNARPWYVIPPKSPPDYILTVTHPPLDRINELGTHADFTVVATYKGPPITYQWYKLSGISNRVAIQGATQNVLCIEGVGTNDVAGYEVVLSQGGIEQTNLLANLSVIRIACGASVQGEILSPITAFTSGSVLCEGKSFTKLYSPYDNGQPVLIYGPWVPPIYQVGKAVNSTKQPKVTVSTHNPTNDAANFPADTGIRLQNSAHYATPPQTVYDQCSDSVRLGWPADPNAARLFVNPMSASSDRYVGTYKVTVYYNGNPPPSGYIYWNWRYHNDSTP